MSIDKSRLGVLACALFVGMLAPAGASAEVTSSNVTSPADQTYLIDDDTLVSDGSFTVSGTSDGTTGDTVDIVLEHGEGWTTLEDDVPVAADGSFSAEVDHEQVDDDYGVLRAFDGSSPELSHRFSGPRIFVSEFSVSTVFDGPNAGGVYDYTFDAHGLRGYHEITPATDSGVADTDIYSASFDSDSGPWDEAGGMDSVDEDGSGIRSSIQVDGRNAYSAEDVAGFYSDGDGGATDSDELAGFPALDIDVSADSANGTLTVVERGALVRCPTDSESPDAMTCPALEQTGVELVRTWTIANGHVATVHDEFRSTDGASHAVSAHEAVDYDESETGWAFGDGTFDRYEDGYSISGAALPGAPFVMTVRETDDEPSYSPEGPAGGIVFHQVPSALVWTDEERMQGNYDQVAVPANGSASIRHTFTQGWTQDIAVGAANAFADALAAPVVAITAPANGAKVTSEVVAVTGTVADVVESTVVVNGVPAFVNEDGTWVAIVTLNPGANTLTAVATDGAGLSSTATRSVTYAESERVTPGLTRKLSPKRDTRGRVKTRVIGKVVLPAGIAPSDGCDGTVVVSARAGKKGLDTRVAAVRGDCRYRARLRFARKRANGRSRVSVTVRFTGNRVLGAVKGAKTSLRLR